MVFDNPRGRQAIDVSSAFTGIMVVFLALRLYTRFFIVRYAGIEDYMILLSMICSIGLTICIGYQAKWGMGKHVSDLSLDDITKSLKSFWCSLIFYYLSLGLTKASILLQYQRVFLISNFKIASWCTMAVVIIYTIWTVFSSIFACIPIRAFWTKEPSKCIDQFAMWFTNAAINILTDLVIIILPMPVIRSLNLAQRQKQALIGIFAVGGFVCIVSILRLQSLVAISNSKDQTYDNPSAATWSSVEANVGIICSCLPLLRPLMARCLPGVFSSDRRNANSHSTPRLYPISRSRYSKQIDNMLPLNSTKRSSVCSPASDIKVITRIQIRIDGEQSRQSDWRTPISEISDRDVESKTMNSIEELATDRKDIV